MLAWNVASTTQRLNREALWYSCLLSIKLSAVLFAEYSLSCWPTVFHCRYFKRPLNIFLGFIPEIVFMSSLFGYLVLLVFYKWTAYDAQTSKDAPSLLIHFINMCLFNYNDPTNKPLYMGQVLPTLSHRLIPPLTLLAGESASLKRFYQIFIKEIAVLSANQTKIKRERVLKHCGLLLCLNRAVHKDSFAQLLACLHKTVCNKFDLWWLLNSAVRSRRLHDEKKCVSSPLLSHLGSVFKGISNVSICHGIAFLENLLHLFFEKDLLLFVGNFQIISPFYVTHLNWNVSCYICAAHYDESAVSFSKIMEALLLFWYCKKQQQNLLKIVSECLNISLVLTMSQSSFFCVQAVRVPHSHLDFHLGRIISSLLLQTTSPY